MAALNPSKSSDTSSSCRWKVCPSGLPSCRFHQCPSRSDSQEFQLPFSAASRVALCIPLPADNRLCLSTDGATRSALENCFDPQFPEKPGLPENVARRIERGGASHTHSAARREQVGGRCG